MSSRQTQGDWRSGSAARLHREGRGFKSLIAHHKKSQTVKSLPNCIKILYTAMKILHEHSEDILSSKKAVR